jgi:hypothetical protein
VSATPGQGQPTGDPWQPPADAVWATGPPGDPWQPPADAAWATGPPARRGHVVRWVLLGAGFVLFVLPVVMVVVMGVSAQQREHQPPQSLFDDASRVGAAFETLSAGVPDDGAARNLTGKPTYQPSDPLPVRISPGSVTVGNPSVTPPTVVRLGPGNTATVTGTVGRFCVRVSHPGTQAMLYDSTWHAVQYGRGRSGSCS